MKTASKPRLGSEARRVLYTTLFVLALPACLMTPVVLGALGVSDAVGAALMVVIWAIVPVYLLLGVGGRSRRSATRGRRSPLRLVAFVLLVISVVLFIVSSGHGDYMQRGGWVIIAGVAVLYLAIARAQEGGRQHRRMHRSERRAAP